MVRLVLSALAALGLYAALVMVFLAATFIAGDGVSCEASCSPFTDWMSDAAPWPMLAAVLASLAAGAFVYRHRR